MMDYRDLKSKYDIIVSIEMIEAVGEKYLDKYFNVIKENLLPYVDRSQVPPSLS